MSYIDSATATVVVATLTRRGKELLASDSSQFKITKFAFGDDEINYVDYDGTWPDAENNEAYGTPVLEPSTNVNTIIRYGVTTLDKGTINVAKIEVLGVPAGYAIQVQEGQNLTINFRTLRGYDASYYVENNSQVGDDTGPEHQNGYTDTSADALFQNQSMASCVLSTPIIGEQRSFNMTIKGADTGASTTIPVVVYGIDR